MKMCPHLGSLVFLVLYFVIAFGSLSTQLEFDDTNPSRFELDQFENQFQLLSKRKSRPSSSRARISRVIVVDRHGHGKFKTIQQAINAVPRGNNRWIEILIRPGVYYEKVNIPYDKQYISLVGENRRRTVIQWWDGGGSQTLSYSTFSVFADNFMARNITFKNTFHPVVISQAPAVVIYSDKASFYACAFIGVQDTLTDLVGRHYFESCYIEGYIDFIWGYGQSVYHGCTINVTSGPYDDRIYGAGYITAQGRTSTNDPDGFVFKYCTVVGNSFGYLGRPYRTHSRVVFYKSYLSEIVVPQGWNAGFKHQDATTHDEIECTGPGADTSKRVKWGRSLRADELNYLLSTNAFINQDHWIEKQPFSTRRRRRTRPNTRYDTKPRFRPKSYYQDKYFRPRSYYQDNFFRTNNYYNQNSLGPSDYD